jgi:hypothetical protein
LIDDVLVEVASACRMPPVCDVSETAGDWRGVVVSEDMADGIGTATDFFRLGFSGMKALPALDGKRVSGGVALESEPLSSLTGVGSSGAFDSLDGAGRVVVGVVVGSIFGVTSGRGCESGPCRDASFEGVLCGCLGACDCTK